MKIIKTLGGGGRVGSDGGVGLGGQGGCERRSQVFVKIKKDFFFGGGGGVRVCRVRCVFVCVCVGGGGGQGGSEQRIEVFVKMQKQIGEGGSVWRGQNGCERTKK